jgi:hypothetical protein
VRQAHPSCPSYSPWKQKEWGFLRIEGGKAAEDLENLLMAIVYIDFLQQKYDNIELC